MGSIRSLPAFVVDFVMWANSLASFSGPIFCLEDLSWEIRNDTSGRGQRICGKRRLLTVAS